MVVLRRDKVRFEIIVVRFITTVPFIARRSEDISGTRSICLNVVECKDTAAD